MNPYAITRDELIAASSATADPGAENQQCRTRERRDLPHRLRRRRCGMNRDRRRGRDANLAGQPFNTAENIDWQMGWEDAQRDRGLDSIVHFASKWESRGADAD